MPHYSRSEAVEARCTNTEDNIFRMLGSWFQNKRSQELVQGLPFSDLYDHRKKIVIITWTVEMIVQGGPRLRYVPRPVVQINTFLSYHLGIGPRTANRAEEIIFSRLSRILRTHGFEVVLSDGIVKLPSEITMPRPTNNRCSLAEKKLCDKHTEDILLK